MNLVFKEVISYFKKQSLKKNIKVLLLLKVALHEMEYFVSPPSYAGPLVW